MAIPYQNICKGVALRAMQVEGGNAADREVLYAAASIEAGMDGMEVPYSALKQDVLAVEKELAMMIGYSSNALFRSSLMAQSDTLASGAEIPDTDEGGVAFIGAIDGVFDAADATPMTEQPKQLVLRRADNPGAFFKIPAYHYCFEGTLIFHTRNAVYLRGCAWDSLTAATLFDQELDSYLPQELETLWICKVLAGLAQENWFVPEAQHYGNIVQEKQQEIVNGKSALMTLPQIPVKTASSEPVKD